MIDPPPPRQLPRLILEVRLWIPMRLDPGEQNGNSRPSSYTRFGCLRPSTRFDQEQPSHLRAFRRAMSEIHAILARARQSRVAVDRLGTKTTIFWGVVLTHRLELKAAHTVLRTFAEFCAIVGFVRGGGTLLDLVVVAPRATFPASIEAAQRSLVNRVFRAW